MNVLNYNKYNNLKSIKKVEINHIIYHLILINIQKENMIKENFYNNMIYLV